MILLRSFTVLSLFVINFGRENESKDLNLTIDKEYQAILEKYLKQGVEKFNALSGGAGIMDAETGEILAMANYPSFNLNKLNGVKFEQMKLSFITDPFEPGSVFKYYLLYLD